VTTTDRLDRRAALDRLRSAQKSNRGAAPYSRWINRRIGRQIAAIAYPAGLSPNQVTAISGLFTFPALAAIAVFRPTWWNSILIVAALLLGYAFDSADGQVARLRGGGSYAGEWLDHVLDSIKNSAFHLVIAVCWYRFYDESRGFCLLPLGFAVVSAVFFFAMVLADLLRRVDRAKRGLTAVTTSSVDPNEPAPILRTLIVLPNDYGVLCLALLFLALPAAMIGVYAFLFAANTAYLLAGGYRWFREMRAMDRSAS
jgi:phosphatidylglycerophosphate synthase